MNKRIDIRNTMESIHGYKNPGPKRKKTKKPKQAHARKLSFVLPPGFNAKNAVAAGILSEDVDLFVQACQNYPDPSQYRTGEISREDKLVIRDIADDVLGVVGMGNFDRKIYSHHIRDVLRISLENKHPRFDWKTLASQKSQLLAYLTHLFNDLNFTANAHAVLDNLKAQASPAAKERFEADSSEMMITQQWIDQGGWLTYWYALLVKVHVGATVKWEFGHISLPQAIYIALWRKTNFTIHDLFKGL